MAMPAPVPAIGIRRVAIVAGSPDTLRGFDEPIIKELVSRRHRVLVIAPELSDADIAALDEAGAERAVFGQQAQGLRLFSDWKAIGAIKAILADWQPHVVLGCGGRPMIYAALAAKSVGAERVVVQIDSLPEHRFAGQLASDEMPAWRYGQALRAADEIILHNRDDLALLRRLGLMSASAPAVVVPGAGVDLVRHTALPLPPLTQGLVFAMIAPLDTRKGVLEYCEAAARVHAHAPNTRFLLAGMPGDGPTGLDATALAPHRGHVEYLGPPEDARALLAACHIFVYPSHIEGMPQPVLEAMAAGRPIITTDIPGCRETVDVRVNGCLVPPRNAEALADEMESFLKRPDLIAPIARASRAKAERFCGIDAVSRPMLAALGID